MDEVMESRLAQKKVSKMAFVLVLMKVLKTDTAMAN